MAPKMQPPKITQNALQEARTWEANSDLQQRICDEVITPTLRVYAQYLLGKHPHPTIEGDGVLFYSVEGLRGWLTEEAS